MECYVAMEFVFFPIFWAGFNGCDVATDIPGRRRPSLSLLRLCTTFPIKYDT